jgi:cytochrome o ubiquinol oxidase subunit 2
MKAGGSLMADGRDRSGVWSGGFRVRIALSVAAIALCGCRYDVFDAQGPVGKADALITLDALVIMLAIVVPTMIATWAFAWWFRASNTKARYLPDWNYSGRLELLVWAIPILVIMFLGAVIWIGSHQLDPAEPLPSAKTTKPLNVQVVSMDWKWLFIYPDQGVASVNRLVVPVGTPVHFTLTSASVMNVFFVPQLGSMIYTMNHMADQLWLQADHPGTYLGESGHFSGDGFSDMTFDVDAVAPQAFAGWVKGAQASGPALDAQGYQALEVQSRRVHPYTYRSAAPGLFQDIVSQKLPPGPGPADVAQSK